MPPQGRHSTVNERRPPRHWAGEGVGCFGGVPPGAYARMRITLRVAAPRRFLAVPARTSTTKRFAPRSLRAAFAERTVTLAFLPPLTFLNVVARTLFPAVSPPTRRSVAPFASVHVTGTPVVAIEAAVPAVGAATLAATSFGAAAPASGTAPAIAGGAPAAAAPAPAGAAAAGGGPAGGSGAVSWRPSIGRQFHSSAGASVALSPTTAVLP